MTSDLDTAEIHRHILAPANPFSYRKSRYLGDDISISLDDLGPEDQSAVRALYDRLHELLPLLRSGLNKPDESLSTLKELLKLPRWTDTLAKARMIGRAATRAPDVRMQQVLHDIRGGALQALLMHLQFIDMGLVQGEDLPRLFFLTRDHLKIMRNGVRDIDPEGSARDQEENAHNLDLLVEKWQNSTHVLPERSARVLVRCDNHGTISERCVEFAALDRVIYNLINNAVRFAVDGTVSLEMIATPPGVPEHIRFIIGNNVSAEQAEKLQQRFGDKLAPLFYGGFSTGGLGAGMRVCAEFVANAYGVEPFQEAISAGYIGARLIGQRFVCWFHWPLIAD